MAGSRCQKMHVKLEHQSLLEIGFGLCLWLPVIDTKYCLTYYIDNNKGYNSNYLGYST
uniref:Uncharacterized protein n=1 Tax=Rhodnius prolixus TaxID=13249 RepID=T1HER5_RHOPR